MTRAIVGRLRLCIITARRKTIWKRLAKRQRRELKRASGSLQAALADLEESRHTTAQLRAEGEILKTQVEHMLSWSERWQAVMEADTAVMATRKINAATDIRRADSYE